MLKSSAQKGLEAELIVLNHYERQLGYQKISHRFKTPFAEVDLVLRSKSGVLTLVEVKTCSNIAYLEHRLSKKQKVRLRRALSYYGEIEKIVDLHFAVVSQDGQIHIFTDVFC